MIFFGLCALRHFTVDRYVLVLSHFINPHLCMLGVGNLGG